MRVNLHILSQQSASRFVSSLVGRVLRGRGRPSETNVCSRSAVMSAPVSLWSFGLENSEPRNPGGGGSCEVCVMKRLGV